MKILILSASVILVIFLIVEILMLNRKIKILTMKTENTYYLCEHKYDNLLKQLDDMNGTLRLVASMTDCINHDMSSIGYSQQRVSASVNHLYDTIRDEYDILERIDKRISNENNTAETNLD